MAPPVWTEIAFQDAERLSPLRQRPQAGATAGVADGYAPNVGQHGRGRHLGIAPATPGLVGSELYGSLSDADSYDQIGYG